MRLPRPEGLDREGAYRVIAPAENRGKTGLTSTQVRGKKLGLGTNSWEKPWENDLNFFSSSRLPRTLVRKLNLFLVERGTGLEPATSTLGTIRQPSIAVLQRPLPLRLTRNCPGLCAAVHAGSWSKPW